MAGLGLARLGQSTGESYRRDQDRFNANFRAILATKQRTGGTWEQAYAAVTGDTWPEGQDIVIDRDAAGNPAGGHMQKDPGPWGKIAQFIGPIVGLAAAPFTGGASAALLGATAGGVAGGATGGGKGALIGAGLGAAGGFGASLLPGAGPAAGASAAGSGAASLAPSYLAADVAGTSAAALGGGAAATGAGLTGWAGPSLASGALKYGLPAAGAFLSAYYGGQDAKEQRQQSTALQESALDPFRGQLSQAHALQDLDRAANYSYTPLRYNRGTLSGAGYSYQRSPEVTAGLGALREDVLAGHTVPTMTNARNYGQTGTLNLAELARRRRQQAGLVDDFVPSYGR